MLQKSLYSTPQFAVDEEVSTPMSDPAPFNAATTTATTTRNAPPAAGEFDRALATINRWLAQCAAIRPFCRDPRAWTGWCLICGDVCEDGCRCTDPANTPENE